MAKKWNMLLLLLLLSFVNLNSVLAVTVRVNDTRENNFYLEALTWLLDKSGKEYKIISIDYPVSSQARKIAFVKNNQIDVMYAGTSTELEKQLLPIRFPIMRGLSGQRVFIIYKNYQNEYHSVKALAHLKRYQGIQGLAWGDTQILEASGLRQKNSVV